MRHLAASLLATALSIGAAGAVSAQSPGPYETRADFVYQLDAQLGIAPIYPVFPDFKDVPPSSPYFGYIEAAYHYGITDGIAPGVFGPGLPLTRAEAAKYEVVAYGASQAAQAITSTGFTDNATIPKALVGYVGEAVALGLMHGFPDNTFRPNDDLTPRQETLLLAQLQSSISSAKPAITATPSTVAVGQQAKLAMTAAKSFPGNVTFEVTSGPKGAIISGDAFVATAPGTYQVQATVDGLTSTVPITVYGTPAALKVSAPSTVVANGVSQSKVTVSIVDGNGNVVADDTDTLALYTDSNNGACVLDTQGNCVPARPLIPLEEVASGGSATFTLQSGTVPGTLVGLTAVDETTTPITNATATVAAALQKPTSFTVTPESPYLTANAGGYTDTFDVQSLDQTGNPMLLGAQTFSAALSGPATFGGGATGTQTGAFVGNGLGGTAAAVTHVVVQDVQSETGTVTLSVSAPGLQGANATAQAVITGAPSQIALSSAQTTDADTPASYSVTIEDSHGYPVDWTGTVDLSGSDQNSPGVTFTPGSALTFAGQASQTITAGDFTAGSYKITASDAAGNLTSATQDLTVTPGQPFTAEITPTTPTCPSLTCSGMSYVPLTQPSWQETVQLYDDHGNPAPVSGVEVDFTLNPVSPPLGGAPGISANLGLGTLNGLSEPAPNASVTVAAVTDSQGAATASVSAMAINQEDYNVTADVPSLGVSLQGAYVELLDLAANGPINASYQDPLGSPVYGFTADGTEYTGSFMLQNTQGIGSFTQDVVQVTQSGTGSVQILPLTTGLGTVVQNADGSYDIVTGISGGEYGASFGVKAVTAGSVTLSFQDLNQLGVAPTTQTLTVQPGQDVRQIGFSSSGTPVTAAAPVQVPAGGYVPVTLSAEDLEGNPITNSGPIAVAMSVRGGSGEFRTALSSSDLSSDIVDLQPGQGSQTVYFVNDTAATESVSFDASTILLTRTVPTPVLPGGTEQIKVYAGTATGSPLTVGSAAISTTAGSVNPASPSFAADGTVSTVFQAPASGWSAASSAQIQVRVGANLLTLRVYGK